MRLKSETAGLSPWPAYQATAIRTYDHVTGGHDDLSWDALATAMLAAGPAHERIDLFTRGK
jgi:hypothetical protein